MTPRTARTRSTSSPSPPPTETAPSAAAREALGAAVKAIDVEDYATAERQFLRVTELQPKFPQGWLGLAEVRMRLGRAQDALTAAERARELAPDLAAASFTMARCLAEWASSTRRSLRSIERGARAGNAESILLSALLLRQIRRDDDALKLLEEAWKAGNRDPRLARQLAFLRFDRDDTAGAAAVAEEGLAKDPQRANLKVVLGFALARIPRARARRCVARGGAGGRSRRAGADPVRAGWHPARQQRAADALPHLEEAARLLPERRRPSTGWPRRAARPVTRPAPNRRWRDSPSSKR